MGLWGFASIKTRDSLTSVGEGKSFKVFLAGG